LNLTKSSLKIKGFSKNLLIEKQIELEKEHAIYILEGPIKCYVGQSKDVQSRINNHKDKNKSASRCFILSTAKRDADLRGYLDYMESYAIKEMELLGYLLDNTQKPNPEDDVLTHYKKEMANEWIDEFLSFLPILGFKKSPTQILLPPNNIQRKNTEAINLKLNGIVIPGTNSREVFTNLLTTIGIGIVNKNVILFLGAAFKISTSYSKQKYGSCHELLENKYKYYLYLNISKNDLIKKIIKIKEIIQLNIEIINYGVITG
jgi:hypothetical protein